MSNNLTIPSYHPFDVNGTQFKSNHPQTHSFHYLQHDHVTGKMVKVLECSFCHKSPHDPSSLLKDPQTQKSICDTCQKTFENFHKDNLPSMTPSKVVEFKIIQYNPSTYQRKINQCSSCSITATNKWRKDPITQESLCNRCGLRAANRYKKIAHESRKITRPYKIEHRMSISFLLNPNQS